MIKTLLAANRAFYTFSIAVAITYIIIPVIYWLFGNGDFYFILLAGLALISVMCSFLSYHMPIFDISVSRLRRIVVPLIIIKWWIPLAFFAFILYTLSTAPSIPIVSAFLGASANVLSEERGAFLKGRSGIEGSLIYLSTIFVNTLVPYSLIVLFALKHNFRYVLFIGFFIYSISFLQKALFLNLLLPVIVYYAANHKLSKALLLRFSVVTFGLLLTFIFMTYKFDDSTVLSDAEFLSAQYVPVGTLDFLAWRIFAVPIFTASDTLKVHDIWFYGNQMWGATSGFLSKIVGVENINIERHVFEYQFGGWNESANANAVYFLDGYINFGLLGVIIYGLIVGQFFRVFAKTRDIALSSLWILFANAVFSGSLIGVLLSNGWILILIYALIFKNNKIEKLRS
jgi:hypothetical protein